MRATNDVADIVLFGEKVHNKELAINFMTKKGEGYFVD